MVKVTTLRNTEERIQVELRALKIYVCTIQSRLLLIILNSAQVVKVTTLRNTEEERRAVLSATRENLRFFSCGAGRSSTLVDD